MNYAIHEVNEGKTFWITCWDEPPQPPFVPSWAHGYSGIYQGKTLQNLVKVAHAAKHNWQYVETLKTRQRKVQL